MEFLNTELIQELLALHKAPFLSLYMPTHRTHPENLQDITRFKNLVRELEDSLLQKYSSVEIKKFLEPFEIVSFNDMMTYVYADIRYKTETIGCNVGPNDLFIASIVKFHEGILVTNNEKEFKRIEGLKIENWAE